MDENIHDMQFHEEQTKAKEALISQRIHPGFLCFFDDYLKKTSTSFSECLDKLLQSNDTLKRINMPTQKLVNMKNLSGPQIREELYQRSTPKLKYFFFQKMKENEDDEDPRPFFIQHGNRQQEQIKQLQNELKLIQQEKNKLIQQKLESFRKQKEQNLKKQSNASEEKK